MTVAILALMAFLAYVALDTWQLAKRARDYKPGPGFNPACNLCQIGFDYGYDNGCRWCNNERKTK